MLTLLSQTTAYKALCSDVAQGKPSHAYLLHYADESCLRDALKLVALRIFGTQPQDRVGSLVLREGFTDCKIYPEVGKKYVADEISQIIEDTALLPMEGAVKVYILDRFQDASPIVQNKLLKTLEEPSAGVVFLLGTTTLSPILDTVKSRVKTLTIPPFTDQAILSALGRKYGLKDGIEQAAAACGGVFGTACAMVEGGWYAAVTADAYAICATQTLDEAAKLAQKLGESKYKTQLLAQVQALYFAAYKAKAGVPSSPQAQKISSLWHSATLAYALERVEKAAADLKFNAWFQALVYDLCTNVILKEQKYDQDRRR